MRRDGLSAGQADEAIEIAKEEINECVECEDLIGAEAVIHDHFGLEPDYLWELINL